ncbi:L-rhamnose mutarotase [Kineococcus xinjiangensis]|uniref:L-rhamnose mutarotase n=1 Tax=Kineococcus xinjiangensis TaxID=512762 RepID=A0A2S6IGY2_9ACTN|nr:L-rhamnose mutarotase [Kineococcus xinjiangensis]PPK93469.1 L-rhamnose mutarotase [Kineococcus xinjiangensis]
MSGSTAHRVVFTLQVRPDRLAEYRERHAAVWPEMLQALHDTGWRAYTLHLRADGLLVGVVETDDLAAAVAAMGRTEVNARWQAEMAPFFTAIDGAPDEAMRPLDLVFDLDAQLAAVGGGAAGHPTDQLSDQPAGAQP